MNLDASQQQPSRPNFETLVQLGQNLTVEQTITTLMQFHGASRENVLSSFTHLREFAGSNVEKGTVVFQESTRYNPDLLTMRFFIEGKEENLAYYDFVNKYTGHPATHTS